MIHIADIGSGNILSIFNMLKKTGTDCKITNNPSDIENANKIILPGVGSFDNGMLLLKKGRWIDMLDKKYSDKNCKILGICLGLQLMCKNSEEGNESGLGWIDADVVRFNPSIAENEIKVPHMGWNWVTELKNVGLLSGNTRSRFYFVHAYHLNRVANNLKWLTTDYGYQFVSGIQNENLYGVQFHPEKSHRFGFEFLKKFASLQ